MFRLFFLYLHGIFSFHITISRHLSATWQFIHISFPLNLYHHSGIKQYTLRIRSCVLCFGRFLLYFHCLTFLFELAQPAIAVLPDKDRQLLSSFLDFHFVLTDIRLTTAGMASSFQFHLPSSCLIHCRLSISFL